MKRKRKCFACCSNEKLNEKLLENIQKLLSFLGKNLREIVDEFSRCHAEIHECNDVFGNEKCFALIN